MSRTHLSKDQDLVDAARQSLALIKEVVAHGRIRHWIALPIYIFVLVLQAFCEGLIYVADLISGAKE